MTMQGSKVKICDMQFSLSSYRTGCIISRHHCLRLGQTTYCIPVHCGTHCASKHVTLCDSAPGVTELSCNFNAFKSSCDKNGQALLPHGQRILCSDIQFSRLHFRMQIFLYKMKDGHRQWVNTLRTELAGQIAVKKGRI